MRYSARSPTAIAQDGVITDKERSKLQVLARALEIDPARADRIETEAKAARYHQAVSEAIADGTVTEEEARLLNRLQMQLGIDESAWTPGDLVPRPASAVSRSHSPGRGAGDAAPVPPRVAPVQRPPAGNRSDRLARAPEPLPPRPIASTGQSRPSIGARPRSSGQPREVALDGGTGGPDAVPLRRLPDKSRRPGSRAPARPRARTPAVSAHRTDSAADSPRGPRAEMPADAVPVRPVRAPEPLPPQAVARIGRPASSSRGRACRSSGAGRVRSPKPCRPRCDGTARARRSADQARSSSTTPWSTSRPAVLGTMRRHASTSSSRSGSRSGSRGGAWATTRNTASISPDQRANYLRWLAGGRTAPLDDIGYAFLFFYGLERRLLVEQQDLSPIVKEVVRLLETYTFSGSFDGYLSRFLSYTLARAGIGTLKEKWFEAVFDRTRAQRDEQHLAVGLAWLFSRGLPLPANWALRIARLDPRAPRSVVLERLPDQFQALFVKRYREQFGDGMVLKGSKRDREVTYRPASPSLLDLIEGLRCDQAGPDPPRDGHPEPVQAAHRDLDELHRGLEAAQPGDGQGGRGPDPRGVRGPAR